MSEWIKVSDRLPKDHETCLLFDGEEINIGCCWIDREGLISQWVDCHLYALVNITHWMILPPLPKDEE